MAKILIVDDDPVMLRMVAYVLSEEGHEIERAADGLQALRRLEEEQFDLVVSDVRMPELDGLGLLARLRGDSHTACTPAILLTAQFDAYENLETHAEEQTVFLQKPLSSRELTEAVNQQLAKSPGKG